MGKNPIPPPYPTQEFSHQSHPTTVIVEGAPPIPGQAGATVMIGTPIPFGPSSQRAVCPHCHAQVLTRVEAETTTKTHIMALLLCAFLCLPCMFLPYCMDSCKNKNHYCPSCGAYLGTHNS